MVARNLDLGVFYVLAVSSISTIGILMAGWSSANKYSLMGGLRAAGQLIAYELPLILAVVGVVIMAGTMSLTGIVEAQASWFSERGWSFGMPFILVQFVGFAVFIIASLAELSPNPLRHADRRVGARDGLRNRILGLSLSLLLPGRIRQHVLAVGDRRHPLPRRLLGPGSERDAAQHLRTSDSLRQESESWFSP